jgi:hypothetical protein
MEDDEFDEFLLDPTHFMLTKVIPRKTKNLEAFSKLYFREIYDYSMLMEFASLGDEDVQKAFRTLSTAGDLCKRRMAETKYIFNLVEELGFPHRGGTVLVPFDAYADSLRGLVQSVMDVKEYPEQVLACIDRIEKLNTHRTIEAARKREINFCLSLCTPEPMSS